MFGCDIIPQELATVTWIYTLKEIILDRRYLFRTEKSSLQNSRRKSTAVWQGA